MAKGRNRAIRGAQARGLISPQSAAERRRGRGRGSTVAAIEREARTQRTRAGRGQRRTPGGRADRRSRG